MLIQTERRLLKTLFLVSFNTMTLLTACSNSYDYAHSEEEKKADKEDTTLITPATASSRF